MGALRFQVVPLLGLLCLACSSTRSSPSGSIAYPTVQVADVGNPADYTGYGRVDRAFAIGTYEVTIGQYATFLNAVARSDPYGLYNPAMGTDLNVAGIRRQGDPGAYVYVVMDNGGDSSRRPISYVSWFDAARFANWMSNGQPSGSADRSTTEDGAYPLLGRTSGVAPARSAINPNTGAPPLYTLPSEDEWYKAAYYRPGIAVAADPLIPARNVVNPNTGAPPTHALPTEDEWYKAAYYSSLLASGAGGYFVYATQSNSLPGNVIGSLSNQANFQNGTYSFTQSPTLVIDQNYLTDVGAFTSSASHYGTFDQNGNVFEWFDLAGPPGARRAAGFRGGSWYNGTTFNDMASGDRWEYHPASASDVVGIRLSRRNGAVTVGTRVTMEFVTVGDPGNAPDPASGSRFGSVDHVYDIGRFEVTIAQYTAFLNAVAAADPHGLYNVRMGRVPNLAGISRSGDPGSYVYTVMINSGSSANRPIGFVDWYAAARFANWMSNGQPAGAQDATTTENGAYDLTQQPATEYSSYYQYAAQSNDPPGNVVGSQPNQANYVNAQGHMAVTQALGPYPTQNYLTDVGAFTASVSHYGTYDQIGNVYEWNDLGGDAATVRGIRGSCWFGTLVYAMDIVKLDRNELLASYEANSMGFRLVRR